MKLNDFSIGTRVAALAGTLILTVLLAGGMAWHGVSADAQQFEASSTNAQAFEAAIDLARGAQVTFKIQIQEWKNTLLRGGDPAAFAKYSKAFAKEGEATQAKLMDLKGPFAQIGLDSSAIDGARAALAKLSVRYSEALSHYRIADPDRSAHEVDAMVKGMDREPTKRIDEIVETVIRAAKASRAGALAQARERARMTMMSMLAGLLTALLLGVLVSWSVLRSITLPLQEAVHAATEVAAGRLSGRRSVAGKDEVGQLTAAMSRMSASLQGVVTQVREAAQQVSQASQEMATGHVDLSARTESQSSTLQQTAATIEELNNGVKQSADHAAHAQELATKANDVAERGGVVVGDVVQTMNEINASARKIAEIISVIDGIAFQTNILALNAAVEAARAGEQGRGFAVVAAEVRALAQRSANAAREIKGLINASVDCCDRGNSLVGEAGETMASAVLAVRLVRDVIAEITVAAREQATGIGQVSQAVSAMDVTMQQNAAMVEEAAATASCLRQQSQALEQAVGFFQT